MKIIKTSVLNYSNLNLIAVTKHKHFKLNLYCNSKQMLTFDAHTQKLKPQAEGKSTNIAHFFFFLVCVTLTWINTGNTSSKILAAK